MQALHYRSLQKSTTDNVLKEKTGILDLLPSKPTEPITRSGQSITVRSAVNWGVGGGGVVYGRADESQRP